ncbi:MAG TPA: RluA family pseudouridine synthase [Opitutales bacterium]|nr:RluA family pseudouridine synthase [Opitutales bacterium]
MTEKDTKAESPLPLAAGVTLLCEDSGIVALSKPEGVRAHPNAGGTVDPGALLAAPFDPDGEFYTLPGGGRLHLLHRIDAPTSGVLILTANEALAKAVRALFASHAVRKRYLALVVGEGPRAPQLWRDRLKTVRGKNGARTIVGQGDPSEAAAKTLSTGRAKNGMRLSLLSLEPATGRTHQLRVQCASRRIPIVGDATYGDFAANRRAAKELGIKRLCLHAERLSFELDWKGGSIDFHVKSPEPEFFKSVFAS